MGIWCTNGAYSRIGFGFVLISNMKGCLWAVFRNWDGRLNVEK